MKVLAVDTSAQTTAVALIEDEKVIGEVLLNTTTNHSISLMPTVQFLCEQAGFLPSDLTRIAVAQGPGSYTGLRIGVTLAKTLALTLNLELVGISSLLALAMSVQARDQWVVPIMDARRGFVYLGAYQNLKSKIPDQYIALEEALQQLSEKVSRTKEIVFTGDAVTFDREIRAQIPQATILSDSRQILPSAYQIGRLAETMIPVKNIHDFNPNYLKKVEAEEKWEKEHGQVSDNEDLVSRI